MPRRPRVQTAGYLYHVLNRGAGRQTLFVTDADYDAFERVLEQTADRGLGVAILADGVMPNHWHPVLRPEQDDSLSEFMRLLTVTHAQRWHAHRHSAGTGPVYQGRFKSFPIQEDRHAAMVLRYVERNPLRAGLLGTGARAEDWRWSSLWRWHAGDDRQRSLLAPWPWTAETKTRHGRPRHWLTTVNAPQTADELEAIRAATRRGRPLGDPDWIDRTASALALAHTLRPRGRPRQKNTEK